VVVPLEPPGWAGFYTGFDVGYMDTRVDVREPAGRGRYNATGYGGGSFIGYNWQFGSVVAGLEGIISIHETKGELRPSRTTGAQGDHLWSAGVKGRLGYSFGAFLPYVAGGYATTEFTSTASPTCSRTAMSGGTTVLRSARAWNTRSRATSRPGSSTNTRIRPQDLRA
jgi:outer membrane immunogenic protein